MIDCQLCMNEIQSGEATATINGLPVHLKCYEREALRRTISAMKPSSRS